MIGSRPGCNGGQDRIAAARVGSASEMSGGSSVGTAGRRSLPYSASAGVAAAVGVGCCSCGGIVVAEMGGKASVAAGSNAEGSGAVAGRMDWWVGEKGTRLGVEGRWSSAAAAAAAAAAAFPVEEGGTQAPLCTGAGQTCRWQRQEVVGMTGRRESKLARPYWAASIVLSSVVLVCSEGSEWQVW